MEAIYTTLHGKKLNLDKLTKNQKRLLKKIFELYQKNEDYHRVFNEIHSNESLKMMGAPFFQGQYWEDEKACASILYQVLDDLFERLAFLQQVSWYHGFCKKKHQNARSLENEKMLKEFLS